MIFDTVFVRIHKNVGDGLTEVMSQAVLTNVIETREINVVPY